MTRDEILQVVAQFYEENQAKLGIMRIGVFGSVAREQLTDASDVDVVVELASSDLLIMVAIKQDLEELLHRPVDIVRYREGMSASLKRHIERDAVYV